MNELNISAVDATAMETAATTSAQKHKWLSKLTRGAKKATMFCTIAGVMASACATQAFAAGTGAVDTSSFISTACTVLKSVICLIGAGVGVWGLRWARTRRQVMSTTKAICSAGSASWRLRPLT